MANGSGSGPLTGLKIIDMSRVIAGPYGAQILGDLGADVIKIERRGEGDEVRRVGPPWMVPPHGDQLGESTYFQAANRNKRSVAVDFAKPAGAALIREMARQADVLLENYRTGTLERYGLGFNEMHKENPGLIYCSITGFGQTGPYKDRSGYDYLIQGMAGLMSVTGLPDGEPGAGPMRVGIPVADVLSGMNAVIGVLAALEHRRRTGAGQHIDISLFDSQAAALLNTASAWLNAGETLGRTGNDHPSAAPYGVYEADDGHLIIATFNDREFGRLAKAIGRPEWIDDPRFARNGDRVKHRAELKELLAQALRGKTRAQWVSILNDATVSAGPINGVEDMEKDDHAVARDLFVTMQSQAYGAVRSVASPLRLSATPPSYRLPPPVLGEHTDEVLEEFGISAELLNQLKAEGAI